jgi:hypothetical protein
VPGASSPSAEVSCSPLAPPPTGQRNVFIWLDAIISQYIQPKLTTIDELFEPELVFTSLTQDQYTPPADDQYVYLVPGRCVPDQGVIAGAAPGTVTPMVAQIGVVLWSRLSVDVAQAVDSYLTDASLGALQMQRKIIKSLQQYDPVNASGNFVFAQPMRLGDDGWLCRPRNTQAGWGSVAASFNVWFLADLVS